MREGPDIARVASLIGDPARASMLTALLRTPALTAGELASEAAVTAQTASGHLAKLREAGLLVITPQGRHRYYSLAGAHVGETIEQLLGLAARLGHNRWRPGPADAALRRARTCYDHMAGEIAVAIFERMERSGGFASSGAELGLTAQALNAFADAGIGREALLRPGRSHCRACLDWSERRPHLAGTAGSALLDHALKTRWVARAGRTLSVTPLGEHKLGSLFAS
jgi:DNA-binding transcriptional ArsR family regulator